MSSSLMSSPTTSTSEMASVRAAHWLLPKKGDLTSCHNWRGIALLDITGKLFFFFFFFLTLFYFAKSKREFLPNDKVAKILRGKKKKTEREKKRRKEKSVYALEMIVSWKSDPLSNMAFATVPCSQRAIA